MTTLITDAQIITVTNSTITDGAMVIEEDKISWVGNKQNLPEEFGKKVKKTISCRNKLITPGLIDCHTHIVYAGIRADEFSRRLNGESYEDIAKSGGGIASTVKATRKASFEELLTVSLLRVKHLLLEGVTTIEIKSGYGLDQDTEIKMLAVAKEISNLLPITVIKTFLGAHTCPKNFDNSNAYIDFVCNEVLPAVVKENLADAVDIFCENIAFNCEQVTKLFNTAKKFSLPVKIHAEQLSNQNGAKLAAKYKALSADHLEYITEDGVKAMAESGTVAVLLPGAFYFLQEKRKPPIDLLRKHNVPIAIATDSNPGSSPTCSLLLMLNMACVLFGMTMDEALKGVTINAAKALGIEKKVGSIEVQKQADFVIWDIKDIAELAYNFGFNPGKQIYKNGKLIS